MAEGGEECLRCHHANTGCDATFPSMEELKLHAKWCLFQQDTCPQCEQLVVRRDLPRHMKDLCDFRPVVCEWCGRDFLRPEVSSHQNTCQKKSVSCQFCEEPYLVSDRDSHFATCQKKPIRCYMSELGCQFEGDNAVLEVHRKDHEFHFVTVKNYATELCARCQQIADKTNDLESKFSDLTASCTRLSHLVNDALNQNFEKDEKLNLIIAEMEGIKRERNSLKLSLSNVLLVVFIIILPLIYSAFFESKKDNIYNNPKEESTESSQPNEPFPFEPLTEFFPKNNTLDDIVDKLAMEVFKSRLLGRRFITDIHVGKMTAEEAQGELADGTRYAVRGRKGLATGLSVSRMDPIPDRALWCLMDSRTVLYCQTLRGDVRADLHSAYPIYFGWFSLLNEAKLAQIVAVACTGECEVIKTAFLVYKTPLYRST